MGDLEKKLKEKSIEELIVIFFATISQIFYFLISIIESIHNEESKQKELSKIQENCGIIFKGGYTSVHISEYWSFLFNYKSLDWAIREIKKMNIKDKRKLKIIIDSLDELKDKRNDLAHGGFLYEEDDFNSEELLFHREKFDSKSQKFEKTLKGNGREELTNYIINSHNINLKLGIIGSQLKKGEKIDEIISIYFDMDMNIIKIPTK